jgi:hypothetical protein
LQRRQGVEADCLETSAGSLPHREAGIAQILHKLVNFRGLSGASGTRRFGVIGAT